MTDTLVFTRGMDTYVDSADPTTDHSQLPFVPMLLDQTVWLLKEGVGDVPFDASAGVWELTFTAHEDFDGTPLNPVTIDVYRIETPWVPSLGYADMPTLSASAQTFVAGDSGNLLAGETATVDVSIGVAAIAAGNPFYGWAVKRRDVGTLGSLCGLRADPDGPVLTGGWVLDPEPPTGLVPAAGQVVGCPRPTVRFDWQSMLTEQVQIHSTASGWVAATGWPSPDFDSGEVATTDPMLDLDPTAITDLVEATDYYWTARVENANGWGDYCEPVGPFTYVPRVVVTITSPLGISGDCNPFYEWTTDGAQVRSQVLTAETGALAGALDDSGEVASATQTYQTVGKVRKGSDLGVVLPDSRPVTGEVRAWDDVANRVATPGCPVYGSATTDYTFGSNATVPPPDSVTVTQIGTSHGILFQVLLQSAPQYIIFTFGRDNDNQQHIARRKPENLEPPTDIEGSLLYEWPYFSAEPWQPGYVGGAKRVDGNQASDAEYGVLESLEIEGFNAIDADPNSNTYRVYAKCSGVGTSASRSDQIGILQAYGDQFAMTQWVTESGLVLNVQGAIRDFDGTTASEWQRAWRRLCASGKVVQVAYDDVSFPAVLYNYSVTELEGTGSPFLKAIQVTAIQVGLASYADETVGFGDGPTLLVYDFEEGIDGDPIVKESLGGSPGVIDKDGNPVYSLAAGIHGAQPIGANLGWPE